MTASRFNLRNAIVVIYGNIQWICVAAADGLTCNDDSMLPEIHSVSDFNVDSMYSTGKDAPAVGCDIMMTPNGIAILGSVAYYPLNHVRPSSLRDT